jgi:hypothetical protein
MMKTFAILLSLVLVLGESKANDSIPGWSISILPSSVRIDPSTHRVYDQLKFT